MPYPLVHIMPNLMMFQSPPLSLARPGLPSTLMSVHVHAPLIHMISIKSCKVPMLLTKPDLVPLSSNIDFYIGYPCRVHFDSNHSLSANPRTAVMSCHTHAIPFSDLKPMHAMFMSTSVHQTQND